jgi:ATP-binding cassette subfamily F protein 3
MEYSGTLVFVSHDRYFIDRLATRVFEIGDGKVEIFPGNYEDYRWRKEGGQQVAPTLDDVPGAAVAHPDVSSHQSSVPAPPANGNRNSAAASVEAAKKRLNPIKRRQMEDRVTELEEEITKIEATIARCEAELQNFVSAEESQRQSEELDRNKASHAALIQEWEDLAESLESSD